MCACVCVCLRSYVADRANTESTMQSTMHYIFDAVMPIIQVVPRSQSSRTQLMLLHYDIISVHSAA